MSNVRSIPQTIDIVDIVLDALSPTLPECTDELRAALDTIDDRLTAAEYDAVWSAALAVMSYGQREAFRLGWKMRSQL